ncbi:MAG: hypothetical protein P8X51_18415 [Maritimibacter sp.]
MIAHPKLPLTLSGLAALLALGAALTGIVHPPLYQPMTPDNLMPGTLSQDIISLAVSLALLACLRPAQHLTAALADLAGADGLPRLCLRDLCV